MIHDQPHGPLPDFAGVTALLLKQQCGEIYRAAGKNRQDAACITAYTFVMNLRHIHWVRAIGGAIIAEVLLVASAFAWVAVYSYLINPNQPLAVYEQHALDSGPWVSILAGVPLFYAVARWIARDRPTALAFCTIVLVFDAMVIMWAAGTGPGLPLWIVALSYGSKLMAVWFGGAPVFSERRSPSR